MWIYTAFGFFSVVQDKENADVLWVRARYTGDLENLRDRFLPDLGPVLQLPGRDYRYRAQTTKFEWAEALAAIALELDYSNFKNEVTKQQGHKRHDLYLRVWGVMIREQDQQQYPNGHKGGGGGYVEQASFWDWPEERSVPRGHKAGEPYPESVASLRKVAGNDYSRRVQTLPAYDTGRETRTLSDPWTSDKPKADKPNGKKPKNGKSWRERNPDKAEVSWPAPLPALPAPTPRLSPREDDDLPDSDELFGQAFSRGLERRGRGRRRDGGN